MQGATSLRSATVVDICYLKAPSNPYNNAQRARFEAHPSTSKAAPLPLKPLPLLRLAPIGSSPFLLLIATHTRA